MSSGKVPRGRHAVVPRGRSTIVPRGRRAIVPRSRWVATISWPWVAGWHGLERQLCGEVVHSVQLLDPHGECFHSIWVDVRNKWPDWSVVRAKDLWTYLTNELAEHNL